MSKFAQPLLPLLLIMIEVKGLGRREKGKKDEDKGNRIKKYKNDNVFFFHF